MENIQRTGNLYRVELATPFDNAIERVVHELGEQGFRVFTWIDMADKLKEHLDATFTPYVLMGVCDPTVVHRALGAHLEAGLVLPYNVIVYETEPGRSMVAAITPKLTMSPLEAGPALEEIAEDADARLRAAIQALATG